MSPVLEDNDDIGIRLDRLEKLVSSLNPSINATIVERLDRLELLVQKLVNDNTKDRSAGDSMSFSNSTPSVLWGQPPPHTRMVTQMVNNAVLDSEEIIAKSKRAVLEKVPEQIDAVELVRKVAAERGLMDEVIFEEIHRHPKLQLPSGKNRIVKVPFVVKKNRDIFLKNFRKTLTKFIQFPKNVSVRRDLTRPELNLLYELRRKAYAMNQSENMFKYVVVDLSIITLKTPHPLRPLRTQ
ncbi:hypothetical protein niasHT_004953 [Heterodera trifolii]|uniref:Uncharacterized protein n=1 Tax=Heterodera trifolii TaxID=157864 RepID=A0ABD2M8R1_9BILA